MTQISTHRFACQIPTQVPVGWVAVPANAFPKKELRANDKTYTLHACIYKQTHGLERMGQVLQALFKMLFCLKLFNYETHQQLWGRITHTHYVEKPMRGEVFIERCEGKIGADRTYDYTHQLQDANEKPFSLQSTDLYLCLRGNSPELDHLLQDARDPQDVIRLPHTLFANAMENSKVQFVYRDRAVELTCKQANSMPALSFQEAFQSVVMMRQEDLRQSCAFPEDQVEPKPIKALNIPVPNEPEFKAMAADIEKNGAPARLAHSSRFGGCVFEVNKRHIELESIKLHVKYTDHSTLVWLYIPHRPELNQFPAESPYLVINSDRNEEHLIPTPPLPKKGWTTYTKETWKPLQGDRRMNYIHGQCAIIEYQGRVNPILSWTQQGFLFLTT